MSVYRFPRERGTERHQSVWISPRGGAIDKHIQMSVRGELRDNVHCADPYERQGLITNRRGVTEIHQSVNRYPLRGMERIWLV